MKVGAGERNILKIFNFFVILLLANSAIAQKLNVRNYNVQDGLIQSQVFSIIQDDQGYLWIGTAGGLSRFDGKEFKRITKRHGLFENFVLCGIKDKTGKLWFGHGHGRLSRVDPINGRIERFQLSLRGKPIDKTDIIDLYLDNDGRIWVLTLGKGLFYFQNNKFYNIQRKDGLRSNYIYDVEQVDDSTLWVITARGLATIQMQDTLPKHIDSLKFKGLKNEYLLNLSTDSTGNGVWFSVAENGLYYLNRKTGKLKHFTKKDGLASDEVWNFYIDRKGNIWFIYNKNGISFLSRKDWENGRFTLKHFNKKSGLSSNSVNKIYEDDEGNYWLGLDGKGIDQLREKLVEYYLVNEKNEENIVWNILKYKEEMWFGVNDGIVRYDLKTGRHIHISKIGNQKLGNVTEITIDNQDNIWFISFGSGIFKYNPVTKRFSKLKLPKNIESNYILSIDIDDKGKLWLGFLYYGLLKYDPINKKFEHFTRKTHKVVSDTINVIYNDHHGNLWIGTANSGLIKYDGRKFQLFAPETGVPFLGVSQITRDPHGNLWLLTNSDELMMFDGQKIHDYTDRFGLSKEALYSLVFWRDELWLGTNRGVVRIVPENHSVLHFGLSEGFAIYEANERAVFMDPDSMLWFGTIRGAVRINPRLISGYQQLPKVHIKGVKVFTERIQPHEIKELPYNRNHLTFLFNGLFFKVPEWVQYQYKLEGFDPHWSFPVKERYVTYSYLPPGNYTFKVRASIDGKHWTEPPVTLSFVIKPPFYKTWWFLLLSSSFGLIVILFTIYYRDVKNKRIQRLLEQKVDERTRELQREKERVEQINKALTESETKFRTLTEISPSAIFIYKDFKFVYVNPATESITGYSKEELIGKHIVELVHPDYKSLIAERAKLRLSGKPVPDRYEFKIINKSGEERWIDFSARGINYEGEPAGLGTVFDITERKRVEEELIAEKERLSAILTAIGDGVIALDKQKNIILCNKKAFKMLGIKGKGIQNYTHLKFDEIFKLQDEKSGAILPNPVAELLEKNGAIQIERTAFLINQEGKKVLIDYSATPILDPSSQIIGVVLAFRDITDKRRLEKELLKSQKLESIGVLAGGIAHDFNNFLTAIMGNLSLIRMQLDDNPKLLERVQSAEKAANRAQELTHQLLTFSKGGAPVKKTTDLRELVKDSSDFVLSGSNVDYVLEADTHLWAAQVDAGQISQVIQNLIINANQAMPNGGTIRINLENFVFENENKAKLPLKPGKYIKLTIRDEGIGIPQKYLTRIFDPFFSTKQSGSGLGLATAFSIISKHEGHIEVQSEVGKGTEFTIYLPASDEPLEKKDSTTVTEILSRKKKGALVMIMDDEEMIRDIASELFSQLGFLAVHAEDGKEAVTLYKKLKEDGKKIDLVIMDLTIPGGMGGKEAVQELLKIDKEAVAIVSSGYSNDPVMAQYKEHGFKGCLKKPFKIDEIVELLQELNFV